MQAPPAPLFILAPPRSYTSVVGGILGQHPDAYGLPEVNLSLGDTLGAVWSAVSLPGTFGKAGLLRLLAQLHEGRQTEDAVIRAQQWIQHRLHWPVGRVFAHLQEAIGPQLMVEKSPWNTMRPENLERLLRVFPEASFLHLTRHPRTAGRSSAELRRKLQETGAAEAEGIAPPPAITTGAGASHFDPERLWLRAHQNILEFAATLPPGQCMRIKGEALLTDLQRYLPQICDWLGVAADADSITAMLHPETSPYACLGPPGAPYGNDPNFIASPALDLDRLARIGEPPLEGPLDWAPEREFSAPVLKLARQFGYG